MKDQIQQPLSETPARQPQKQARAEDMFGSFKFGQIKGFFPNIVTTAPTLVPRNFLEQIQFYSDTVHGVYRIYFYDTNSSAWHYATLT